MSILVGIEGAAFVTDASGTFSLAPGVPIDDMSPPSRAVLPLLVTDSEAFPAATVLAGSVGLTPAIYTDPDTILAPTASPGAITLLPGLVVDPDSVMAADIAAPGGTLSVLPPLVSDADSTFRPLVDALAPPLHGSTQHLRCGPVTDADTVYAAGIVGARLLPDIVLDADAIPAAATSTLNTLRPALAIDSEAVYGPTAQNIRITLAPSLVQADDSVFAFATTLFLAPQLVASDDAIGHADVGWKVFTEVVDGDDQFFDVGVETRTVIAPEIYIEDEHENSYPFYVHGVEGGISTPRDPDTLSGSIKPKFKVLTGSVNRKIHLTGSLSHPRPLSGSLRRGAYPPGSRTKR